MEGAVTKLKQKIIFACSGLSPKTPIHLILDISSVLWHFFQKAEISLKDRMLRNKAISADSEKS